MTKRCEYCGAENVKETVHCRGCGTVFAGAVAPSDANCQGHEPGRVRKRFKPLGTLCALLVIGLFAFFFLAPSTGPGVAVSFSGYSTNRAGVRVGIFTVVSSNQHQILFRAMSEPEWSRILGPAWLPPFSPERSVQYGRLPASSRLRLEVRVPAAVPPGRHYHISFAYCQDPGGFGEQVYRFWRLWILRWVPYRQEQFPAPGFGSRIIVGPEVEL